MKTLRLTNNMNIASARTNQLASNHRLGVRKGGGRDDYSKLNTLLYRFLLVCFRYLLLLA